MQGNHQVSLTRLVLLVQKFTTIEWYRCSTFGEPLLKIGVMTAVGQALGSYLRYDVWHGVWWAHAGPGGTCIYVRRPLPVFCPQILEN